MSIATINSYDGLLTKYAKQSLHNVQSALQKEASGLKSNNPGEFVSESAVANSLEGVISGSVSSRENLYQGADLLDYGHATVSASLDSAQRIKELLQKFQSPNITERDKPAIQSEIDSLVKTLNSNAQSEYNGLRLLDGSFAGKQQLSTLKSEKIIDYDITNVDQYVAYNGVRENKLLATGSTVQAVDHFGRSSGTREIDISGLHAAGDRKSQVVVNGKVFTGATLKPGMVETDLKDNEFVLGADAATTKQNLVRKLNLSKFNEVAQASYRAGAGDTFTAEYSQPGSVGESFLVEVRVPGGSNNHIYDLGTAEDARERATLKVKFDSAGNYAADQKVMLNSVEFTFKDAGQAFLDTDVEIDTGGLEGTLKNLFDKIRSGDSKANEALYDYDAAEGVLTVKASNAGVIGNEFTFNFAVGGAGVAYTLSEDGATAPATTEDLAASISSVADKSVLATGKNPIEGTMVSKHESTFDKKMVGVIQNLSAVFIAGDPKEGAADLGEFVPNKVQFKAVLNGEVYQTNTIALAGGNKANGVTNGKGSQGLGNFLAGGTTLIFQKVGAANTDAGFSLKVQDAGMMLTKKDSVEEVQAELTKVVADASKALEQGAVKLGITAPSQELEDFGLSDITQFGTSGFPAPGAALSGAVAVVDRVGHTQAQGSIKLAQNLVANDFLYVGGTRLTMGEDIAVGATVRETRDNILGYLSQSKDSEVTQAFYTAGIEDEVVIVTYKQSGNDGNQFKIGAKTATANSVELNGHAVDTANTEMHRKLGDDETKSYVTKGDSHTVRTLQFSPALQGRIENIKATFVEGKSRAKPGDVFTPNAVALSATIGGESYSGQVLLSGGEILPGDKGTPIGSNYNKLGNYLSPGSDIVLASEDKSHAVVLHVGDEGLEIDGRSLSDINRQLNDLASKMEQSLSQVQITQTREVAGFDDTKTVNTNLEGLRKEHVLIRGHKFDASGSVGNIGNFTVDGVNNAISVTIDGMVYSQALSEKEANGGLGHRYDSQNRLIKGGMDTTLTLATVGDRQDDRALVVNLQGVSDIDISTPERARKLERDLNAAFGVNSGQGVLAFQAGASPSDIVEVAVQNIGTNAIFQDQNGREVEIILDKKEDVPAMLEVADNAVGYLNLQLANLGSTRAQFNERIKNIDQIVSSLRNSVDLQRNADVYETASEQARASLQTQAAMSAFVHSTAIKRNIAMTVLGG